MRIHVRSLCMTLRAGILRGCAAAEEYGAKRDLYRMYYDFDVINDRHARRSWVPPTR